MKLAKRIIKFLTLFVILIVSLWIYIAQPSCSHNLISEKLISPAILKEHVRILSVECYPRNFRNPENLDKCSEYIAKHFKKAGANVSFQEYVVNNRTYRNVIGRFGENEKNLYVAGAHYDSYENTPGADDNASGTAGLIELAYLVGQSELEDRTIELVAYCLEEPPFFRTKNMGSYRHAKSLHNENKNVRGVIVLEMIGYYSDKRGSQSYPSALLKMFYPNRGNFLAVIGKLDQRKFTKQIKTGIKGTSDLSIYSINAPKSLPGIDFSDHRNYWAFGYNAVMVSDTAFYRNFAYHKNGDTVDRLDFYRMAQTVIGVYESIMKIEP